MWYKKHKYCSSLNLILKYTIEEIEKSQLCTTYFIRTPIDLRKACVNDSVLLISRENISLPAIAVKGVSGPSAWAIPEKTISKQIKYQKNIINTIKKY